MRSLLFSLTVLTLSAGMATASLAQTAPVARGQALVADNCSSCHATGARGESPVRNAPAFRTLSQNYPVSHLEESLAQGIDVGHETMPVFTFAPRDVNAIVAYLETIQTPRQTPQRRSTAPAVGR